MVHKYAFEKGLVTGRGQGQGKNLNGFKYDRFLLASSSDEESHNFQVFAIL